MADRALVTLAHDLEWLGCELEYYGHKHAQEGFPEAGPNWTTFLEKQRGVLITANKIERELKSAVRFNPATLVGVEVSLDAVFDVVTRLLAMVEDIKHTALFAVHDLPHKVREFSKMVEAHSDGLGKLGA